jgi:hypothetical protein
MKYNVGYIIQIRMYGEWTDYDSDRDWLHDCNPIEAEYKTFDEAAADLETRVDMHVQESYSDPDDGKTVKWRKEEDNDYGGNGFWFVVDEPYNSGRALIREVRTLK